MDMQRIWMRLLLCLCLTGLAACTSSVRVSHVQAMGTLGQNYEQAVAAAIDRSKAALVDASSIRLLDQRSLVDASERETWRTESTATLDRANKADSATVAALDRAIAQARLLERYFAALTALAAFDGETAVTGATRETAATLASLVPDLAGARIGGVPIPQVIDTTTPLVVGALKSRPLEHELRERGPALLAHLRWQKQLLVFLADRIAADNAMIAARDAKTALYAPYGDITQPVDDFIAARRAAILAAHGDPAGLRAAATLSDKLHDAIVALAEGRLAPADLPGYARDVSRLVDVVEGIAGRTRETTP